MKIPEFGKNIDLFNTFGDDFDRFAFPADIRRVTAGHGGESFLIMGSGKAALYDCGMAYCGEQTAENIAAETDHLDYIILSHSHYDHMGGLPYIRDRFPEAVVFGSEKCRSVLGKDSALELIRALGEEARELYVPGSKKPVRTDGIKVDEVLHDGDVLSLGEETITAYETKGHTDCSMSFYLKPAGILFTSESTGILEGKDYVHTPVLKSFPDAIAASYRCEGLSPKHICLPHFGMIPQYYNERYFREFRRECKSKTDFVRSMLDEGLTNEEMLTRYIKRYWTPAKEMEQPIEAFEINSGHILHALLRAIEEEGDTDHV